MACRAVGSRSRPMKLAQAVASKCESGSVIEGRTYPLTRCKRFSRRSPKVGCRRFIDFRFRSGPGPGAEHNRGGRCQADRGDRGGSGKRSRDSLPCGRAQNSRGVEAGSLGWMACAPLALPLNSSTGLQVRAASSRMHGSCDCLRFGEMCRGAASVQYGPEHS